MNESDSSQPAGLGAGPVTVVIEPTGRWVSFDLRGLWEYRELLYFLVWRDVKVRYKQTVLGAAWAILQPTLTMVVFTIFFGRLAGIGSEGVPYPVFSFAALLPWTFFAQGLTQSSNSLVGSSHLITKVYFPRLVIPLASVLAGAVDFALAFLVLLALMAFYGIGPTAAVLALPPLFALAFATALGVGHVALGAQRPVPRRALCGALLWSDLAFRDPGDLPCLGRDRPSSRSSACRAGSSVSTPWRASSRASAGRCSASVRRPGR